MGAEGCSLGCSLATVRLAAFFQDQEANDASKGKRCLIIFARLCILEKVVGDYKAALDSVGIQVVSNFIAVALLALCCMNR